MKINFSNILESSKATVTRFPVTLCFLAALTIQMLFYTAIEKEPDWLTFFFSVGMLLSLLLHVCTEETETYNYNYIVKNPKAALLWGISILLLGLDSYALHIQDLDISTHIAQSSAIVAMIVAVCFYPFIKEKDDRKSWNFVLRLTTGAAIGMIVGLIMMGGLELLYFGSMHLFDFEPEKKISVSIMIVCLITLPVSLFLIRIPSNEDKHNDGMPKNKFLLGVTRFLFLPLTLLYMGVLYVYGAKILYTWTLPNGMLATLVSTMMCALIGITFLLYPYIKDENHQGFEIKLTRILPLIALPLLILMSVGIYRRFADYGVTAMRLYVLTFNIWLYVVAIGLWITKARRIHWICISFTFLLLLTSVHPWNYNRIYQKILVKSFLEIKEKYHITENDLEEYDYREMQKKMPEKDAREFNQTIYDIQHYDYKFSKKVIGNCPWVSDMDNEDIVVIKTPENSYEMTYDKICDIETIAGYKYIESTDLNYKKLTTKNEPYKLTERCGYSMNDSTFILHTIDYGDFVITHKNLEQEKTYTVKNDKGDAALIYYHLNINDPEENHKTMNFDLKGYIFYNNPQEQERK